MSDTLRIMVRETRTERRPLTREEAYAWGAGCAGLWLSSDAETFLKSRGYVKGTYCRDHSQFGSADFNSISTRKATVDEINAWHTTEQNITPVTCQLCDEYKRKHAFALMVLKDKEIVLEVVKDGDA